MVRADWLMARSRDTEVGGKRVMHVGKVDVTWGWPVWGRGVDGGMGGGR